MTGSSVGIKDVAREAGVSITTVSHALNGKGRIPEDTRRRVRGIAERLGYQPNAIARSLAGGRTGVIAIAFSLGTHLLVIYLPVMQEAFHTVPLSLRDWMVATGVSASLLVAMEVAKIFLRARDARREQASEPARRPVHAPSQVRKTA